MVNKVHNKKSVVVKLCDKPASKHATAKGGLVAFEALANRSRLWSDLAKCVPPRRCTNQGYSSVAVLSAVVHGLLSGGEGFACTEPLRGDTPLQKLLGLERVASAETVEEVMKYQAQVGGHGALLSVAEKQCSWLINHENRKALLDEDGLALIWGDGSLLEVEGKDFEAIKVIKGKRGQLVCALFFGPYLLASDFADEGECELIQVRDLLHTTGKRFVDSHGLATSTVVLLDSLYGDGPTLTMLEEDFRRFIVGGNKLSEVDARLAEIGDGEWLDTTKQTLKRGWDESAVCTLYIQCADWTKKRLCVARRWKNKGEMIYQYSGVFTNITRDDPRIRSRMTRLKLKTWEEAIWSLYDRKQASENQWKELLEDMGLHHPPSSKVQANAVFYATAALAYNLSVGLRRLGLEGSSCRMRLWRLRRELIDMSAEVARHCREAVVHVLDARAHLVEQLRCAMQRLAIL